MGTGPVEEWQKPNDIRRTIRIADLLRMSSGLRFIAPQDPDFDRSRGYPDHLYVYTGAIAATAGPSRGRRSGRPTKSALSQQRSADVEPPHQEGCLSRVVKNTSPIRSGVSSTSSACGDDPGD